MRTLKRLQKRCAVSSVDFMLNRLSYETTPIPLELINLPKEIAGSVIVTRSILGMPRV